MVDSVPGSGLRAGTVRVAERWRDGVTGAGLAAAVLVLAGRYTRGRLLWSDELLGWMVVTDPSPRHAFGAWWAGADGGGLWFYVLARLWLGVFGETAAAFRMFSAAGVAAAVVLTFWMARRWFGWGVSLFAVGVVWFSSDVVLWQVMQARFYGLLVAGVALCGAVAVWSADRRGGWRVLLVVFGAHTLLAGTHPFGVVYSGVVVLAMVLADGVGLGVADRVGGGMAGGIGLVGRGMADGSGQERAGRRWRPAVYGAAVAGWWVLVPSWPALRSSQAVAVPHFWTSTPTAEELGNAYSCWSAVCQPVLAVAAAGFLLLLAVRWLRWGEVRGEARAHALPLLLSAGLLLVPGAVFVKSLWGESLFVDRYLLPLVIGMTLVLAQLLTWCVRAVERRAGWMRWGFGAVGLAAVPVLVWTAAVGFPAKWQYPGVGEDAALLRALPKGVPVVVEAVDRFDQLAVYHGREGWQFVSLLDWGGATAPDSLRGEVTAFHEMENWRRVGYGTRPGEGAIEDSARFLRETPEFVVVDEPGLLWMERRVRPDPAFVVSAMPLAVTGSGVRLWRVRRANGTSVP